MLGYLTLRALAAYASISVRSLRNHLAAPVHPLPHYRIGGKLLVTRQDYDAWAQAYRHAGGLGALEARIAGRLGRRRRL